MKKLLTIMVLALALCLLCSVALAANSLEAKYDTYAKFQADVITPGTIVYNVNGTDHTLNNVVVNAAELKVVTDSAWTQNHATYYDVSLTGDDAITGEVVKAWTRVRYDAHIYVEDTARTHRSCTDKWTLYTKCVICGLENPTGTEKDAMAHTWVLKNDANCTDAGYYFHQCENCNAVEKDANGNTIHYEADGLTKTDDKKAPALGHNVWQTADGTANIVVTAPFCKSGSWDVNNGKLTVLCGRCGKVGVNDKALFEAAMASKGYPAGWSLSASYVDGSVAVDAKNYIDLGLADKDFDGHVYGPDFEPTAATCKDPAGLKNRCTICGYTRFIADPDSAPLPVHYVLTSAKDVTCKQAKAVGNGGKIVNAFICSNCNGSFHKPVDAKVAYKNGTDDKDGWVLTIDTGDADYVTCEPPVHQIVLEHKHENNGNAYYQIINSGVPTGTKYASIAAAKSDLGADAAKKFCLGIDVDGSLVKVQPTKCSVCNYAGNTITNVTHTYGAYVAKTDSPTTLYIRYCDVCGDQQSLTYLPCDWQGKKCDFVPAQDEVEAMKCGETKAITWNCANCKNYTTKDYKREHIYEAVSVIVPATCTENGSTLMRCTYKNCGNLTEEAIVAEGHKIEKVEGKAATHIAEGIKEAYKCSVCGKLFLTEADAAANKVAKAEDLVIAKTPEHDWDNAKVEIVKEATCLEAGKKLLTCECGTTKTIAIPKLAHKAELVKGEEPTHTKDGKKDSYVCSLCGTIFADKELTTVVKAADLVIPKNAEAHDWDNAKVEIVKDATCKEAGKKLLTCECGATKTEAIPMIAHTPVEIPAVEPTCNTVGATAGEKCSVCGEVLKAPVEVPVDLTKHVWGDVVVSKAATCEKEGAGLKVCTVCKTSEEVVIPATGHDWGEWEVTTPATLEKDGEATRVCKNDAAHKETKAVKFVPTAPAKYEVKDLDYTNPVATGSVELDPETKALTKAYARVTFFVANGDCMIQIVDVDEAGSFTAGAIGNFTHVSVIIVDDADAYGAEEAIEHAHGNGGIEL